MLYFYVHLRIPPSIILPLYTVRHSVCSCEVLGKAVENKQKGVSNRRLGNEMSKSHDTSLDPQIGKTCESRVSNLDLLSKQPSTDKYA